LGYLNKCLDFNLFMIYLIGLGLSERGYSSEAYDIISKANKIYIENYTVNFPYDIKKLERQFKGKKFIQADRETVEQHMNKILDEAKKTDVALLVYGSPLTATTHITLIQEAKKKKIKVRILHNASVLDAVAETGLQTYKFGRTTSMPNFEADSYMEIVKKNLSIKAHTLILIDIGMKFKDSLRRLEKDSRKKGIKLEKIIVCSRLGNKDSEIYYGKIGELKNKKVKAPFCIIIPGELHFKEEEFLKIYIS